MNYNKAVGEARLGISFLLLLLHVMLEKVLFWGQNFEMEILMNLHVIRFPNNRKSRF